METESELIIQNGKTVYSPSVIEGIEVSTERTGTPGKLTFKVMEDPKLKITEGNAVRFKYKGKNIFYGFIFERKIDEAGQMSITAYDQLRYFKNKDSLVYDGKTLSWLVKKLIAMNNLNKGTITDTKYKIPSRVEDNQSMFDMVANAHDITLMNTGKMYVLYDDFGKLNLKNISSMKVKIVVDTETGQKYDYTSSIDKDTYNQIKLYRDNEESGKREIYMAKSSKNINAWGLLQYYEKLEDGENGKTKAKALLDLYNHPVKKLEIKNVIGDHRIRGGSMVVVSLKIDHKKINKWMLVEKCKHTYKNGEHWMDLTLRGGEISA